MQTREQRGINIIGSGGEPMGKHAAASGSPFALVHACATNRFRFWLIDENSQAIELFMYTVVQDIKIRLRLFRQSCK